MADSNEALQQNYKEFVSLLPLTLSLAGLPPSEVGKYYNEDQIEARSFTVKYAYKLARRLMRECIQH